MNIRRSLAWSFSERMLSFLLQFGSSIAIARLLTPDEVGIFALAVSVSAFLQSFRELGVTNYIVRADTVTKSMLSTAFGLWICFSWSIGLLLFLASPILAHLYDAPGVGEVVHITAFSFLVTPFGQTANAVLVREMRFDILHHITLGSSAIGILISVIGAFFGFSYMALAWGMLATSISRAIFLVVSSPVKERILPSLQDWRDMIEFGGYLTGASIIGSANQSGQRFIIGDAFGLHSVAIYDRANQIPQTANSAILGPLSGVLIPHFSSDIRKGIEIGEKVEKLIAVTTLILFPVFVVLGIFSSEIVAVLYGPNWHLVGEILPFVLASIMIGLLIPYESQILVPYGRAKDMMVIQATSLSIFMACLFISYDNGLMFFIHILPAITLVIAFIRYLFIRRYWGVRGKELKAVLLKTLLVTASVALIAFAYKEGYGKNFGIVELFTLGLFSSITWMTSNAIFRTTLGSEMRAVCAWAAGSWRRFFSKNHGS